MKSNEPPTIESLLEHTGFVRSLARGALGTDDQSDDVAQDAYVAALEKGPRSSKAARSWFYRVVRNRVTSIRRKEASRRKYLQADHPVRDVPSPEEILQREEARVRLVTALLELDPIYREPLVLKYYEDLSPRQIARRLDEKVETIRTRQRRGVERLRALLDEDYRSRKAWVVCMLPLTRLPKSPTATAAGTATLLTATAAAVAVGVAVAFTFGAFDTQSAGGPPESIPAAERTVEPPALTGLGAAVPGKPSAPTADEAPTPSRYITVTVLDYVGDPVEGATVAVGELRPNWKEEDVAIEGRTDAEGRFQLPRIASPAAGEGIPGLSYVLRVTQPEDRDDLEDVLVRTWRPADETVHLRRGFTVAGEVVDRTGHAVPGAFVHLRARDRSKRVETDAFGRFRATGLPPRRWTTTVSLRTLAGGSAETTWTLDSGSEGVRLEVSAGRRLLVQMPRFDPGTDTPFPLHVTEYDAHVVTEDATTTYEVSPDGTVVLYGLRDDRRYALWWKSPWDEHAFASDVTTARTSVTLDIREGPRIRVRIPAFDDWPGSKTVVASARGVQAVGKSIWRDQKDPEGADFEIRGLPEGEFVVTAVGEAADGRVLRGEIRARAGERVTLALTAR